ncbi:MAG: GNAT family N-acetyltransferase [Actinomycetota bacterium]|nr:GNAT family N-acetyltransferase [Actinomycetota bacterium]
MEIVSVDPSDLSAISRLHEHFWGSVSDVATMMRTLEALSADPNHVFLAARTNGACIGTATGVVCHGLYGGYDTYMVVEDMVVDPEHRRQGVASALLSRLESIARERGCNQVILLTESVRSDAIALYRANGFEARWTGFKKKL